MVWTYLDVETDSPEKDPKFDDEVILVALEESAGTKSTRELFTKWELGSEREVIEKFYNYVYEVLNRERTVWFIGFNILRFDKPLLLYKIVEFKISPLLDTLKLLKKAYWRDLCQVLLPFNKMKFNGLREENIAERLAKAGLKCRKPRYSNKEISSFYKEGMLSKIKERANSDLDFIRDLNYNLTYKMGEVMKAFQQWS